MRIQHNITALTAADRLKSNENTVSKNIEKLSSGYRINSAADDAAGLAVSEKMRSEINGLTQAEDNTANGISLVQTAEGGLNETSAILQRMNTLAVEASNGTYKDSDRASLQKEVDSLNTEIDRIANSTNFNDISLLNGSLGGYTVSNVATDTNIVTSTGISNVTVSGGDLTAATEFDVSLTNSTTAAVALKTAVTGVTFTTAATSFEAGGTYVFKAVVATTASVADSNQYKDMEVSVTIGSSWDKTKTAEADETVSTATGSPLVFQVGADNVSDQRATLSVGKMDTAGLGLTGLNISTQSAAEAAVDTIKQAITTVSSTRASLGAMQNELEHTSNNLSTMNENLTSAESTIRDVDMTSEYVQYSKNQILTQAANSMLAQANAQPQNVLTLLKG